ncbi:MAG: hypothetical protein AAGL49_12560, partial [Pseudomonadota bacterium]
MGNPRRAREAAGEGSAGEAERLELIRDIEAKRGSRVIAYITADRDGLASGAYREDVRVLEQHFRAVMRDNPKKVDLFLSTDGGDAVASWRLISMAREFLGGRPFNVLAPGRAMSAGAEVCMGADEVVMGPAANIGPIDTQLMNQESGAWLSVESVNSYFDFLGDVG